MNYDDEGKLLNFHQPSKNYVVHFFKFKREDRVNNNELKDNNVHCAQYFCTNKLEKTIYTVKKGFLQPSGQQLVIFYDKNRAKAYKVKTLSLRHEKRH